MAVFLILLLAQSPTDRSAYLYAAPQNADELKTLESADDHTAESEALAILKQYDQPTDSASQILYLKTLLPDPNRKQRIAELIVDLGHDKFLVREEAYHQILGIGLEAQSQLVAATESEDAEVRLRARRLLNAFRSGPELDKRESLTRAALLLLGHRREARAVPVVLSVASETTATDLYETACETVWKSVNKTHVALLRATLASGNLKSRVISIVALEVSLGDEAVEVVVPFLKSEHETLRLAAARALIDRQPRVVAVVLIELLTSENLEIQAQAHALLKTLFDQDLEPDSEHSLADVWRAWAEQHLSVALVVKLQAARLDLSHGRGFFVETFTIAAEDVTKGYGRFQYESGLPTKASVVDGVLRLEGDHPEADQRLYVTSEKLVGRREWPRVVEVHATLTGESAGRGGYHVGISVGRLKALFHPAYAGGGFRIETVDSHDYLVKNTNMGFTPGENALHDMTLTVTRTPAGATVDVEVIQGDAPKTEFKQSYTFSEEQLGDYRRIGLERSGRTGGAAIFDQVSIRLKE